MLEKIKKTLSDIKDAIVERGVTVDSCDSPSTYASKILSISNNGVAMAFIPVFKVSASKPAKPDTAMSALNPTAYPSGWGEPDNLSEGNVWMSYTLVGNTYVYIPWSEPILVNGEYTVPVSKTFTIFGQLSNLNVSPGIPVGGTWDVANNELVGTIASELSNGGTLVWSTSNNHVDGLYTYVSTGTFSSENGNQIGDWAEPYCINSVKNGENGLGVTSMNTYYKGSNESSGVEAPAEYSDPLDSGWTTTMADISLSASLLYLWGFTRIIYSDGTIWQGSPYIVREYVDVGYQTTLMTSILAIEENINSLEGRLEDVEGTDALIKKDSDNGLIALLTSYEEQVDEGTQKSFADIVVDAADETIKLSVGSALGRDIDDVEATLDGVNGLLREQVTKLSGIDGTVESAIQQMKADAIEQSVSSGIYYWQRRIHSSESSISDPTQDGYWEDDTKTRSSLTLAAPTQPCTIIDATTSPITYNTPDPESGTVDGLSYKWFKALTIEKMSAIKQESDSIRLMVGDDADALASIVVEAINDAEGSIKLNADTITLNGTTIASALNAEQITIYGQNSGLLVQNAASNPTTVTRLMPSGLTANNATIYGNLYSTNGFFGQHTVSNNVVTPIKGVHVGATGLYSSNYNATNRMGFNLSGDSYTFYGADGSEITQQGIVSKKISARNSNYTTSIDDSGFKILNKTGDTIAEFIVYDEDNDYVKLRLYGPNGWVELGSSGVQVYGPSDIEQEANKWSSFAPVMLAPTPTSGDSISQADAVWHGITFSGSIFYRYSNGWKRIGDTTYYYNPADTSTDEGYNLSVQYEHHNKYFTAQNALSTYLVPDGDYMTEPEYAGHPQFIMGATEDDSSFFGTRVYTFDGGKCVYSAEVFFCQWGAGADTSSTEYSPSATYKSVFII